MKIFLEIPTYPYDQEYFSVKEKIELYTDKLFRHTFCKYIDAIITYSNDTEIFGKRTIRLSNGIDFNHIPLRNSTKKINNELHLIGVAEIHFWHGFDRLIKGLGAYYNSNPEYKVYFHLVGNMSGKREQNEILTPIKEYGLAPYVTLYGAKHGEELNELFNRADFAIGSLGRHRSGIYNIKTLKNREYAARGLAFMYSEIDEDFDQMPYIFIRHHAVVLRKIDKIPTGGIWLNLKPFRIRFTNDSQFFKISVKVLVCKGSVGFRHISCPHSPPSLMGNADGMGLLVDPGLYIPLGKANLCPTVMRRYTGRGIGITLGNDL